VAKEPFLIAGRPSKREPGEIPFSGSCANEFTSFILHLEGSCDEKGVDNPQSVVDSFEFPHADRSRHPAPHLAALLQPSNCVLVSLEAGAVDGVDTRQETGVPGFEGSIANLQDLLEAGDDLGSGSMVVVAAGAVLGGADSGGGSEAAGGSPPRVAKTAAMAAASSALRIAAVQTAREGPRGVGGGGAGWSWSCMASLLGEGRMVGARQGAYNRQ
jgi:hypothetical protein